MLLTLTEISSFVSFMVHIEVSESYKTHDYTWEVRGLLFGAHHSSYRYARDILHRYGIKNTIIKDVCLKILKDSIGILNDLFILIY